MDEIRRLVRYMQPSEIECFVNEKSSNFLRNTTALEEAVQGLLERPSPERLLVIKELLDMKALIDEFNVLAELVRGKQREALRMVLTHPAIDPDDLRRALRIDNP